MRSTRSPVTRPQPGILFLLLMLALPAGAAQLVVTDEEGHPLPGAMVTRTPLAATQVDTSDDGYPAPGLLNRTHGIQTRFTDNDGVVNFTDAEGDFRYRVRAQNYRDATLEAIPDAVVMGICSWPYPTIMTAWLADCC